MSATSTTLPPELEWKLPARGQVGMYALIGAESAIFTIFVVAYLFYIGKSLSGPMPSEVLSPPIFYTHLFTFEQPNDSLCSPESSWG